MDDVRVPGKKPAKRPAKLELKHPAASSIQPKKKPVLKTKVVAAKKPVTQLKKKRSLKYRIKFWWKLNNRRYGWRWRAANVAAALLILFSVVTPVTLHFLEGRGYQLSSATLDLVGKTDPKLTSKLTYDAKTNTYQFNKESIKEFNPADQLKQQVGTPQQDDKDKALYSLDVSQDPKKGVTYYDTNSQLGFKLTPQFGSRTGKLQQQRLVYPLGNHTQAVYTLKNNGLKEDIVVQKATEDTMRFSYTLQLPKTLEAKAMDDGSGNIGIYSANPSLFGNISYGSDKDREQVEKARENGAKDTLVFGIPAPTITTSKGDDASNVKSRFELKDNTLTVVAEGLTSLKQPFSIDPSVVITSATDFESGNDDGNISFATAGSISRASVTGGTVASWSSDGTDTTPTTSGYTKVVFYNGYYYLFNYAAGTGGSQTPYYAAAQSGGDIGAWTATTNLPNTLANHNIGVAAYNGYLYITESGASNINTATHYIKINPNGSLAASWTAGPNLNTARAGGLATAYNGRLYVVSGCTSFLAVCLAQTKTVEYANINPDGSLGNWTTTTSTNNNKTNAPINAYNGYLYAVGSGDNGGTSIEYAPINSDGSLGTWVVNSNSLVTACQLGAGVIANGYLYYGPCNFQTETNTIQYAPIYANGSVGSVQQTSTLPANRSGVAMGTDGKGHIVVLGGSSQNTIYYTSIKPAGVLRDGTWPTGTSVASAANSFSRAAIAYNGYLYFTGGLKATGPGLKEVQYAAINSDGSLGAWTATTSMNVGRLAHSLVVHDGYLYALSGCNGGIIGVGCSGQVASTEYAPINADGTIGAWTNSTTMADARYAFQASVHNGYVYAISGVTTAGRSEYAQINTSTHALGAWTATTSSASVDVSYTAAYNGHIYARDRTNGKVYEAVLSTSDGSVGTWSDANAADLNLTVSDNIGPGLFISKGYAYANHSDLNSGTVEFAKINSDGTITSWTNTTAASTMGAQFAAALYNDVFYIINLAGTTQYQLINHGGKGDVGGWDNTSPSLGARESFQAAAYNGYLYALGGNDGFGIASPAMKYASIGSNGVLGSWAGAGNYPTMYQGEAYVMEGGYVYKLGGKTNSTMHNETYHAAICTGSNTTVQFGSNGSITDAGDCTTSSTPGTFSSWNSGTTLNTARGVFAAVAYNGYLYAFGGCGGTSGSLDHRCRVFLDDVEISQINATTGAPGSWTTLSSTYDLVTGRRGHQAVAYNGYVYISGGCSATNAYPGGSTCTDFRSDVLMAKLNGATLASDAGCGAVWCKETPLLYGLEYHAATAYNGHLYITGGWANSPGATNTIFAAPISHNGHIGEWVKGTTGFTTARRNHGSTIVNGNLYVMGGTSTGGSPTYSDVQFSGLSMIPRKSLYSKLLTFPFGTSVRNITYNGTLGNGLLDVSYRGSSSGTSWTGSVVNASNLSNVRCPTPASNRYMQLMVILDDTQRGVFPDETANAANLTDLTLSYEFARPPNMRLKLGKILQENLGQTDLDICKLAS